MLIFCTMDVRLWRARCILAGLRRRMIRALSAGRSRRCRLLLGNFRWWLIRPVKIRVTIRQPVSLCHHGSKTCRLPMQDSQRRNWDAQMAYNGDERRTTNFGETKVFASIRLRVASAIPTSTRDNSGSLVKPRFKLVVKNASTFQ